MKAVDMILTIKSLLVWRLDLREEAGRISFSVTACLKDASEWRLEDTKY